MKTILLLLLAFIPITTWAFDVSLKYKVAIKYTQDARLKDVSENKNGVNKNTVDIETFLLSKDRYIIKKDSAENRKTVYDFYSERITNYKDNTFETVPLFYIINTQVIEFENRKQLSEMLEAGGVDYAFGGLFNLESLFGLEGDPNNFKSQLKIKTEKGFTTFSYKEEQVVSVELSKYKIQDIDLYKKFLLYNTHIHPVIIEYLSEKGFYPKSMEYKFSNVGNISTVNFTLLQAIENSSVSSELIPIQKLSINKIKKDSLELFIDGTYLSKLLNKTKLLSKEEAIKESDRLISEKKYFESLLCLFEYLLQSGKQVPDGFKKSLAFIDEDQDMKLLVGALQSGKSKDELNKAIADIQSINQRLYKRGYLLDIFIGNKYTALNSAKDVDFFGSALRQNPDITGVYKDLGQALAGQLDFSYAWKCYDIALLINEESPMLQTIKDLKILFRKDFPMHFNSANNN